MASFLVIGMGMFGRTVATELFQMKHDVLAVDVKEENISGIVDLVSNVTIGDAKDEAVLHSLGVQNFDCVVVAIGEDAVEDSLLATIMLKEMGAKRLICKAHNEWHAKILTQIGADRAICPENDMGKRVAHSLAHTNILDYFEITPEYGVVEIVTPTAWGGKSIFESNLRRKYGITVIAIKNSKNGQLDFSPSADTVMHIGDVLTVLGATKDIDAISVLK